MSPRIVKQFLCSERHRLSFLLRVRCCRQLYTLVEIRELFVVVPSFLGISNKDLISYVIDSAGTMIYMSKKPLNFLFGMYSPTRIKCSIDTVHILQNTGNSSEFVHVINMCVPQAPLLEFIEEGGEQDPYDSTAALVAYI